MDSTGKIRIFGIGLYIRYKRIHLLLNKGNSWEETLVNKKYRS